MAFKPNRDLLNVNFEGYTLSPSPVTCLKYELKESVHVAQLKDVVFSVQHMKAFSLHNHLFSDPFDDNSVYWYCQDGTIHKGIYEASTNDLTSSVVYSGSPSPPEGTVNATLVFVRSELCLFSPGGKEITVFYTGKRSENTKWEPIKSFAMSGKYPVMIVSAAILPSDHTSIQLLCAELLDPSGPPSSESPQEVKSAVAMYTWCTLKFKGAVDERTLCLDDVPDMIVSPVTSFPSKSLALYTSFQFGIHPTNKSSTQLLFMSETVPLLPRLLKLPRYSKPAASDTPTADPPPKEESVQTNDADEPSGAKHYGLGYATQGYSWSQTSSEVTINFELPSNVTKKEVDCVISPKELVVGLIDGTTYFRGELNSHIDTEGSTWTIENNMLDVTLEKKESGVHWPYLHRGEEAKDSRHHVLLSEGKEGDLTKDELEQVMAEDKNNSDKCDKPPDAKRPRPSITSEWEDCDKTTEDSTMFIIGEGGEFVSKAVLSGRQLIFVSQAVSGHPPYFALRHDVDAVIWLPSSTSSESPNDHPWTHVNTFNALGYVQASKENRKFTTCPANLKFVAISDCTRHVFVYLQPPNGFRDNAALEFVHTLSEKSDILGLAASDDGLVFVLTSNTLIALKIPMTI